MFRTKTIEDTTEEEGGTGEAIEEETNNIEVDSTIEIIDQRDDLKRKTSTTKAFESLSEEREKTRPCMRRKEVRSSTKTVLS
jgi:hypothetical protein